MKTLKYKLLLILSVIVWIVFPSKSFAQEVREILNKVKSTMENENILKCDLTYNMYNSYYDQEASETIKGKMIKEDGVQYTEIDQTIFYTNPISHQYLKLNKKEKALEYLESKEMKSYYDSEQMIDTFMKLFKSTEILDKGQYYICVMTSDKITPIPYGRVEIKINKSSFRIDEQVLYYLTQHKTVDTEGNEVYGNPKLQIKFSNYTENLSGEDKQLLKLTNYIKKDLDKIIPIGPFKDFEVYQ